MKLELDNVEILYNKMALREAIAHTEADGYDIEVAVPIPPNSIHVKFQKDKKWVSYRIPLESLVAATHQHYMNNCTLCAMPNNQGMHGEGACVAALPENVARKCRDGHQYKTSGGEAGKCWCGAPPRLEIKK